MPDKRIIATFHPQAWHNNYAFDVDPEGETEWDATEVITAMGKDKALKLKDNQYETDDLRYASTAPGWIRDWSGPFYVEVEDAISEFYKE